MTPQQIVGLVCRLFALWLVVAGIQALNYTMALKSTGVAMLPFAPALVLILYLLLALVIWTFPMAIANRLVPRTYGQDRLSLPVEQVVPVACIVLGMAIIAFGALTPLAGYVTWCIFTIGHAMTLTSIEAEKHLAGLSGLLQLVAGLLLIFKAGPISKRLLAINGLDGSK